MNKAALKAKVTKALRRAIRGSTSNVEGLIPKTFTAGKMYEAYVLAVICQKLATVEACKLTLVNGTKVTLKSSPGPINSAYPHIRVERNGEHFADIWTDVEFTSLSATKANKAPLTSGDYHEIDVAVIHPNANARPHPDEVLLAAECKNTGYQKNLLRETLGTRRELSLLVDPQPTAFASWPRPTVPAHPPSCIVVYSTDSAVLHYSAGPGACFGIDFFHEPL